MDVDIKESEIQARSRIIKNHLTERNNCIVLKIDTHMSKVEDMSPFGFHFEFDAKKYKERKKQIRKQKITRFFAWLAYYHHKFGIRHITLISLLVGYVFLGGFMFERLESPRELEDLKGTIVLMQGIIDEETQDIINVTLSTNGTDRNNKLAKLIKRYYKTMLEAEGRFHGSVWHKAENLDMHLMWYFSSATFYSMTLFSTIGYGTISCQTTWGRSLSMVYASIGLPIMLVVLGDIGEWFQKVLTNGYVFLLFKYKQLRKQPITQKKHDILLPMWLALFLVLAYILICTFTITIFDHNEGNKPGIGFYDAFYFTFISLTTIGLGDVMPYNIQYSPFLAAAFLLGLALISIVNTSIYAQLYRMFFNMINNVEDKLDRIHSSSHRGPGYRVFQDMEPVFRMLVCTFPPSHPQTRIKFAAVVRDSFREKEKRDKDRKRESNTSDQIKLRTRTESDIPAHDGFHLWMAKRAKKREMELTDDEAAAAARRRAPTLGAFGGFDMNLFRPRGRANTSPFRQNDSEETEESDVE